MQLKQLNLLKALAGTAVKHGSSTMSRNCAEWCLMPLNRRFVTQTNGISSIICIKGSLKITLNVLRWFKKLLTYVARVHLHAAFLMRFMYLLVWFWECSRRYVPWYSIASKTIWYKQGIWQCSEFLKCILFLYFVFLHFELKIYRYFGAVWLYLNSYVGRSFARICSSWGA